jgi:N utilization substance protein A
VQAVVQELRNEKIDIVQWSADPADYVCRALAPAKVAKIFIDDDEHAMEVIVPDDQLSLAIGKKGQNVRLASRLTGWRLDVRGESDVEEEAQRARRSLGGIEGVSEATAEQLYQNGYKSADDVSTSDAESLAEVDGIGTARAVGIIEAARVAAEREAVEAAEAERLLAEARAAAALVVDQPVSEQGGDHE